MEVQAGGDTADQQQVKPPPCGVAQPASTADLPQTRQSRPYRKDFVRRRPIVILVLRERDGARPDQRHLPAGNVIQLRKFVERMAPAEGGEATFHAGVGGAFRGWDRAGNALDGESPGRGGSGVPPGSAPLG